MLLHQLLGLRYPLIQGGMAHVATGAFAASVSNAGGLGLIASGGVAPEQLIKEINTCRAQTNAPFGVNIMMMHPQVEQIAQIVLNEHVPVVTTGAGNPGKYIEGWRAGGIKVLPVVPSVALAVRMQRAGADAIVVEGCEAGGHIGELTTMALLPQVVDAVSIPVVAAGGIADGRQVLAAFCMGASGVQVGTCLLASEESPIHPQYKQAIINAKDTDTTVTGRIAGVPVRLSKNKMAREYVRLEKEGAPREELEQFTLGSLRKAVVEGDCENGSLMAGQVAGMVQAVRPVKAIIEELFAGCKQAYEQLANLANAQGGAQ